MKKECIHPPMLFDSRPYGFSQVVVAQPGKMAFISGQVAWDEALNLNGENDLSKQTEKAIDNLKAALSATGASLDDVVMLRIYKVNYQSEEGQVISEALRKNLGSKNPPASTWINVKGLPNAGFMIEIEAQVVV